MNSQPRPETLPDIANEGDRPSITEVNGTVARFEMSFNPGADARYRFGPPWWQRLPSFIFLGFAVAFASVIFVAHHGPSNTALFHWAVEGDATRVFGSGPFGFLILLSALATVLRAAMRGVVVTSDGVEARSLILGIPRVQKWTWAQIDRLVLDDANILLELWNGRYEKLPKVSDPVALSSLLERIAIARSRQVTRLARAAR